MKPVFADTSFFVAWAGPDDPHHAIAVERAESCAGRIVTTEYVLAETGGMLCRPVDRVAFVNMVRDLRSVPNVLIVSGNSRLFRAGFDLYASRLDKSWSMVDCVSFTVMRQRRLTDALTADHHFEQAGFRALLRVK
jgi:predicted nucleic acid-binding protein